MKVILHILSSVILLSCFFFTADAQFTSDSSQTFFVCNASGSQVKVSAFDDGTGGTYSFWIDQRNGNTGTAIYGQHLDSSGVAQWPVNGKLFFQENAKEVWNMKAIGWQSGILITWYQGGFGLGGDTLYCNYYDSNGNSNWANPVVVANKQGSIISVGTDNLDIYPNDSGATITYELGPSGGNTFFSFNRIDFTGNLRWPLDSMGYQGNGYYYVSADDYHGGFYIATSTGGLGTDIFVGHFDFLGNSTIPVPVNVSTGPGGRGNSAWKISCDNDTSAYVVWASYTNGDISISKVRPNGNLPWGSALSVCAASGTQDFPDLLVYRDTLYVIWDDPRPGAAGNFDIYMQKMDKSGTPLWTADGIPLSHLISYIPYPKLAASGNNVIAAFELNNGFHAQEVQPDSSVIWYPNGINVNTLNPPSYGDFKLVTSVIDGSVTAIWSEAGADICAARLRPGLTVTGVKEEKKNASAVYPNPASDHLFVRSNDATRLIEIVSLTGQVVVSKEVCGAGTSEISIEKIHPGFYFARVTSVNGIYSAKISILR